MRSLRVRKSSPVSASLTSVNRRLALFFLGFMIFLAACTSEGLPADFADQNRRTEAQFVSACETALAEGDAEELDGTPAEYCQCSFFTLAVELGFEEFRELDEQLRDDPTGLSLEDRQLIDSVSLPCSITEADVYG